MTSDANAKLPIPTYALVDEPCGDEWRTELLEQAGGDLCKADDVRGLVERMEKAEAQRGRLAEVLRLALELAEDQDDNLGSWCEVWEQAAQALADIEKENA